ncbi:ABC transporter permease [Jidongwangia harbinensis]|uniref:ABC transporter permease n=1 Tax=Jidongwangia harbinensis TaxID=2878561 RepID=UPI001CDA2ECD|nr:ABC transporter permease [Jidongwangia harbinensis]MCA2211294.1 ABC transporter permease [Jidongwangia harbinensis]
MVRVMLRSVLSRKLRLVLSGLAVVLGVMFVSGAFVLTDALGRSYENLFATVHQNTDVQVRAGSGSDRPDGPAAITAGTLAKVRGLSGVASATGVVSVDGARVVGADGKVVAGFDAPRLGSNWTGEDDLVRLRSGRGPDRAGEIVVNAGLAEAAGLRVGDRVGVLTTRPKQVFTLVGITGYSGGRDSLGGAHEVSFHESEAARLMLGRPAVFSAVDVTAAAGTTPEQVRDAVRTALGDSFRVRTGAELRKAETDEFKDTLGFFTMVLLGFASVALFVGTFLILNTFSILVAQRTRELALMRALGASRRQTRNSVLVEAVLIGLFASGLGLAAGVAVGYLLAWLFSTRTGADLELASVAVPVPAVVASFSVGLVITVVAALLPAVRASRIPPMAALREAATPDRPLTRLTVAGSLVAVAGGVLLVLGLTGDDGTAVVSVLGGVLLTFVGVALLTPILARPVVGVIGRALSWSVPGKLGRLNSARNPRRTAITAAALMVGVALITGVTTIVSSIEATITSVFDKELSAELIISGDPSAGRPPTFDPAVLERAREIPGVTGLAGDYTDVAQTLGEEDNITIISDLPAYARMFNLRAAEGTIGTLGPGEVLIDAARATRHHLRVGSTTDVRLARGKPRTMTIAGIYADSQTTHGLILPPNLIGELRVPQPSWAFLDVADGTDVEAVRRQVDALLADSPEVTVSNRSAFVGQQTAQLDSVLRMVQILLALAVLIAVLGIVNTLALSVLERTREIGLLRAIGLRRGQVMRMVTVEAVVISLFGALLGIVLGGGLGAAVMKTLESGGLSTFAMPWAAMGTYLVLGGLIGVVAAVLPAIRAARVNVLRAISYE